MRSILRSHPFLSLGLLGTVLFGVWLAAGLNPRDGGIGEALFYMWRVLAAPVHLATNVLSPITDTWPDVLDGLAAVAVGLLPYALADWTLRRFRLRRSAGRPPVAPGPGRGARMAERSHGGKADAAHLADRAAPRQAHPGVERPSSLEGGEAKKMPAWVTWRARSTDRARTHPQQDGVDDGTEAEL